MPRDAPHSHAHPHTQYALTNYGRTTDYISATPAEIDASSILEFAAARLPGFDETRESIFDKMALRNYVERRDLRVLEREHLRLQRQMQEFQSETMLQVARDLRRGDVRDLVMQGTSKWLGLKHWESHEANVVCRCSVVLLCALQTLVVFLVTASK